MTVWERKFDPYSQQQYKPSGSLLSTTLTIAPAWSAHQWTGGRFILCLEQTCRGIFQYSVNLCKSIRCPNPQTMRLCSERRCWTWWMCWCAASCSVWPPPSSASSSSTTAPSAFSTGHQRFSALKQKPVSLQLKSKEYRLQYWKKAASMNFSYKDLWY